MEQKESARIILQVNRPFSFSTRISTSLTSVRVRFLTIRLLIEDLLSDEEDSEQAEMLIMDKQVASVGNKRVEVKRFMVCVFSVKVDIATNVSRELQWIFLKAAQLFF